MLTLMEGGRPDQGKQLFYRDVNPAQLLPVLNRYKATDPAGYSSLVACICGVTFTDLETFFPADQGEKKPRNGI